MRRLFVLISLLLLTGMSRAEEAPTAAGAATTASMTPVSPAVSEAPTTGTPGPALHTESGPSVLEPSPITADEGMPSPEPTRVAPAVAANEAPVDHGGDDRTRTILLYVPNRLLDLLDVFRLRARLGPGTAVGVRATNWADLYLGSYTSVFAGLPGPRGERKIPIPVGLETKSGVEAGPFDATLTGNFGPDYGQTEFGISLHLLLVGADAGIDPWEIVDFFAGFGNVDLAEDDF